MLIMLDIVLSAVQFGFKNSAQQSAIKFLKKKYLITRYHIDRA